MSKNKNTPIERFVRIVAELSSQETRFRVNQDSDKPIDLFGAKMSLNRGTHNLIAGVKASGSTGFALSLLANNKEISSSIISFFLNNIEIVSRFDKMFPELDLVHKTKLRLPSLQPRSIQDFEELLSSDVFETSEIILVTSIDLPFEADPEGTKRIISEINEFAEVKNKVILYSFMTSYEKHSEEYKRTIELRQFLETTVHLSIYLERPEYHGILTTGVKGETTAGKASAIIRSKHDVEYKLINFSTKGGVWSN